MDDNKRREIDMELFSEWSLVNQRFEWMDDAACKGSNPAVFFPEKGDNKREIEFARQTCISCPVQQQCLKFALDNSFQYGIWGGKTSYQRRIIKARKKAAKV